MHNSLSKNEIFLIQCPLLFSHWQEIKNFSFAFTGLRPYTSYNLTVDVRNVGEEVTGGEGWAVVRTAPGKPGKVHIVSAVR